MYWSIAIVLIGLFLLWLFSFYTSRKVLLTPQFGYVGFFVISTFYATFYAKEWLLEMKFETASVILGGATIFTLVSLCLQAFFQNNKRKSKITLDNKILDYKAKCISPTICIAIMFLQIGTLLWAFLFLMKNVGGSGIADVMYAYRFALLFSGDNISIPGLLLNLRHFCCASGYVWIYLLIYGFIEKENHNRKIYIINIILSLLNSIILGGRGGVLQMLFAAIAQWYFLKGALKGWRSRIDMKALIKIALIFAAFLLTFQVFGAAVGRTSTKTLDHYIADYLSAEIKNLEIFISQGSFGADFAHCQTLIYVANFWGKLTGNSYLVHELDLPFRYVNGYALGNVATAYYAYLYDAGYWGVVFYTALMATICQVWFQKTIRNKKKNKLILISIVSYSYIYFLILFSFFSNKFYENVFTLTFVKYLISWFMLCFVLEKCKYRKIRF